MSMELYLPSCLALLVKQLFCVGSQLIRHAQSWCSVPLAMPGYTDIVSACLLHAVREDLGPAGGERLNGGEVQDREEQMVLPEAALLKALCRRGRETLLRSMAPKLQQLQSISYVGS